MSEPKLENQISKALTALMKTIDKTPPDTAVKILNVAVAFYKAKNGQTKPEAFDPDAMDSDDSFLA